MEDDKRGPGEAAEEPANGMATPGQGEAHHSAAAAEVARLTAELNTLKAEHEEAKDRALRLMAEMENQRRRTERDKSEFAKYAISEFARDVVGVGDNIRRAIEAVPKESVATDPALGSLIEGIEVTERELLKVLEKYQVKRFDPLGEPFNPHLHDAMTKIDIPNVPAETVVQVIHAGFMIDERVLRPAAVIVAKGSVKPEPPAPSGPPPGTDKVPPGAMKVPDDAVSSASARSDAAKGMRPDVQQTVLGREFQKDPPPEQRRRYSGSGSPEERVAQMRRRAANEGNFDNRQQGGNGPGNKASALHKPVIGNND